MSLSNLFNRCVSIVTEEVEAAVHTEAGVLVLNNQIILCPVDKLRSGLILSYYAVIPKHESRILRFLRGTPSSHPG